MTNFTHKYKNIDEINELQFAKTDLRKGSSIVMNYFKSVV